MADAISAGRLILDDAQTRLRTNGQLRRISELAGSGLRGLRGPKALRAHQELMVQMVQTEQ